jgi:hypothetical protein
MMERQPSGSSGLGNRDLTLRPSRRKWILILVGCATFVALAVWLMPASDPVFWGAIVLFGPGCLLSLVKLLSPTEFLRLSADGYDEHVLFRSTHVAWKDVERFVPYRVGTTPMVGIKFRDAYTEHARSRRFARSVAGVEGALSDTYGKSAADLADLLNRWRKAHRPPVG